MPPPIENPTVLTADDKTSLTDDERIVHLAAWQIPLCRRDPALLLGSSVVAIAETRTGQFDSLDCCTTIGNRDEHAITAVGISGTDRDVL